MKKIFLIITILSLLLIPSFLNAGVLIEKTSVYMGLSNDLNNNGKWNQISFADNTTQTTRSGYSMQVVPSAFDPADSSVYYIGSLPIAPSLSMGIQPLYIPHAGTVVSISVYIINATGLATTETSTIAFRLNNTTDTVISAIVQNDAITEVFVNHSLSIPVVQDDFFEIKLTTPAWVTNPLGVFLSIVVYIEH